MEAFLGKPKDMEKAVAQIVSPSDSQEVKLHKIYDRVQQVRNTTFEVQKTAQEAKRQKDRICGKSGGRLEARLWRWSRFDLAFSWTGTGRGFEAYGCRVSDRREYFFNSTTMQSRN